MPQQLFWNLYKEITTKDAKLITRKTRASPLFYSRRVSPEDSKDITIKSTKTIRTLYEDLLKGLYNLLLLENKKIRYCKYLITCYLNPGKFILWSRGCKSSIPRTINMVIESYFKSVKHGKHGKPASIRLKHVLLIMNEKML